MSVIIPVYNGERFLAHTLTSVLEQTYPNLECIVVDDGSTDGSKDAITALASADNRLRYLHQVNAGVAAARNRGIEAANGQLIALLDADDFWLREKLALQVEELRRQPADVCLTAYVLSDAELAPRGLVALRSPADALQSWLLLEGNGLLMSSTALVRREVFDCCGLFDELLTTSADLDWGLRVGRMHRIATVLRPLVLYRQHGSQMHRGLAAYEHDVGVLFARHIAPVDRRRAEANFYVRVAFAHLRAHSWTQMRLAFGRALTQDPRRVIALPATALVRRTRRRLADRRTLIQIRGEARRG